MITAPTAGYIVNEAFKKANLAGLGQAMDGADVVTGIDDLSDMLAQWNEQRWLVWHEVDVSFVSTGAIQYTVGPGGNFNVTPRPARVQAAFVRQINVTGLPVDYPLTVINSREQFDRFGLKSLVSFPKYVFYDPASPLGTVQTYPVMSNAIYELHLSLSDVFPLAIAPATSFVSLPPIGFGAMKFNLARRLRQGFGKKADPELNLLANDTLATIKMANVQIPELVMPSVLVRGSGYNILSDQGA